MKYPKVIFIGGAPMVGKTTVSHKIASHLGYGTISTDDIGSAISAVTNPKTHPEFHYMRELDYREYYIEKSTDELIDDINQQHEALWPALKKLISDHSSWNVNIIIEGWALRPSYLSTLRNDISGVFLLADESLISNRSRSSDFNTNASNEELMISKYIDRSLWYNALLKREVEEYGMEAVNMSLEMNPDAITDLCLELLSQENQKKCTTSS